MGISWAKKNWFGLSLAVLLAIVAVVKYRGGGVPVDGTDLAMPYAGARAWMDRSNPYDFDNVLRHFESADGKDSGDFRPQYMPLIYPPITFVVMTPIALLSWPKALLIWKIAGPIMFGLILASLANLGGIRWWIWRMLLVVLFCLALAPVRNAVTLAQNAVPALCLAILSVIALRYRRDALAGVLLAIAIAFKLQDAIFVLVAFALIRRWRATAWCVAVLAILSLIAIVWHGPLHPGWVMGMLDWIRRGSQPGSIIDPSPANPIRFQMIHLPVLLFTMARSPLMVAVLNWSICGALLIMACVRVVRDATPQLLSLSTLAAISLLPMYHRFPDAILLLLPMVWGISKLGTAQEGQGRMTLIPLLLFLMQPRDVIASLMQRGIISAELNHAGWWQCLVRASAVWAILMLACWLVLQLWKPPPRANAAPAA